MCGITAYIDNSISDTELAVFRDLMVVSSLRGTDSTGVACVYKPVYTGNSYVGAAEKKTERKTKHIVRVAKVTGNPYNLLDTINWIRVAKTPGDARVRTAIFGHCRAATKGHKTAANAHPFVCGHITGVHNGTITSGLTIPEGETDSEAIFETIRDKGVEGLAGVIGAYALIWWDSKLNTINFMRNEDRPLFFGRRGGSLVVSSEKAFLNMVSERHNLVVSGIEEFKPYHHYAYTLDEGYAPIISRLVITDHTTVLQPTWKRGALNRGNTFRQGYWQEAYSGRYGAYGLEDWNGLDADQVTPPFAEAKKEDAKTGAIIPFRSSTAIDRRNEADEYVELPGSRRLVSRITLTGLLREGCAICGEVSDATDWVHFNSTKGEHVYVCEGCVSDAGENIVDENFPDAREDYEKHPIFPGYYSPSQQFFGELTDANL